MANQKAKAAPKTEVKAAAKTEVKAPIAPTIYVRGESKYSPRVVHTEAAWDKVQGALVKGNGKASYKELCDVLEVHFTRTEENHHDFIGYMVRRGALAIAK